MYLILAFATRVEFQYPLVPCIRVGDAPLDAIAGRDHPVDLLVDRLADRLLEMWRSCPVAARYQLLVGLVRGAAEGLVGLVRPVYGLLLVDVAQKPRLVAVVCGFGQGAQPRGAKTPCTPTCRGLFEMGDSLHIP